MSGATQSFDVVSEITVFSKIAIKFVSGWLGLGLALRERDADARCVQVGKHESSRQRQSEQIRHKNFEKRLKVLKAFVPSRWYLPCLLEPP